MPFAVYRRMENPEAKQEKLRREREEGDDFR